MVYEWKDKVVLITGAATSIGAAVVRILMKENVKHVAVLDVNEKAGVSLQNELNAKYGNKVKFYKCDVSDDDQLQRCFDAVLKEQGYIDVVVNNAGIMNDSLKSYRKMIAVNMTALCAGTIKAIDLMSKENGGKGGTVINISSIAALTQAQCKLPIYFGTKSAVLQFSNCIGGDEYYSRNGVRVVAICYGPTDTPLLHSDNVGSFDKEVAEQLTENLNLKRFPYQKEESAAQGLVDAYKQAKSGSTWLAISNKPAKEITATITKAYDLMAVHTTE